MRSSALESEAQLSSWAPSDDWREAFQEQCTEELLKKATRHAARRARSVGLAGGVVDDYYVSELVQDVVGDILGGALRWEPSLESLETRVLDAITSRARHDAVRARRFPHVSIDSSAPDTARTPMVEAEEAFLAAHETSAATVQLAEDAFAELARLGGDDSEVQDVLAALAIGATCKADVMLVSGLSDTAYHVARIRLERLVTKLSRNAQPSRSRHKRIA